MACAWLAGNPALAASPAAAPSAHLAPLRDVAAEAAVAEQRGEPLVILVSLPGCDYCETVRRSYLGPAAPAGELVAREVDMSADTPLRDATGRTTTARAWVRAQGIRVAPTVLFLDRQARPTAPALRGIQPDFYGAYLEQALATSRAAIRPAAR